jgi:hypothetical protein
MKVKLFWKKDPVKIGFFSSNDEKAISLENEINAWLRENPRIKIADIRQSATGGSIGPMLLMISVWYEEGDQ